MLLLCYSFFVVFFFEYNQMLGIRYIVYAICICIHCSDIANRVRFPCTIIKTLWIFVQYLTLKVSGLNWCSCCTIAHFALLFVTRRNRAILGSDFPSVYALEAKIASACANHTKKMSFSMWHLGSINIIIISKTSRTNRTCSKIISDRQHMQ